MKKHKKEFKKMIKKVKKYLPIIWKTLIEILSIIGLFEPWE
jgi:uncharacterized protein (UPF0216 family)